MRETRLFVKRESIIADASATATALALLCCTGCNSVLGLEDGILTDGRCEPSETVACYFGPQATAGVGACSAGLKRCKPTGDSFGPCEGQVTPAPELCGNNLDDDCDGATDEEDDDCSCKPGAIEACAYSGPDKTDGVGACHAGRKTCALDGRFGPCVGEILPRTEDCGTPDDDDCDGSEGCGVAIRGALAGGAGGQWARALAADPWGGAILGGEFEGTLDLRDLEPTLAPVSSAAGHDVFVAHLDSAAPWVRRLIDGGRGSLNAVAVDANGEVAIVGELQGGAIRIAGLAAETDMGFVIKLDASGAIKLNGLDEPWAALLPGRPRAVAIAPRGEIVVASQLWSEAESDVEVAWYGPDGRRLTAVVLGGAGQQIPTGVAVDPGGRVVVVGSFEGALDLGEGVTPVIAAGAHDIFLATLDARGAAVAARAFGDAGDQRGGQVVAGPGGEIALSGAFEGTLDLVGQSVGRPSVFVAKLAAGGEPTVHRVFAGETPPRVALGADGGLLFAADVVGPVDLGGVTIGAARGGLDVLVARLDRDGDHVWSRRYGAVAPATAGARGAVGLAIAAGTREILLSANVDGSVDFGAWSAPSTGADLSLVRLSP